MNVQVWIGEAIRIARDLGLSAATVEILSSSSRLIVRLHPCDAVAKIGPPEDPADLQHELDVARHLESTCPFSAPLHRNVTPKVYSGESCVVSFWEFLQPIAQDENVREFCSSLRGVHEALRSFPLPLPDFWDVIVCARDMVDSANPRLLSTIERARLKSAFTRRLDELSSISFARVPLHGDAHMGNFLMTTIGPRWLDFGDVCMGPVEWDFAASTCCVWDGHDPRLLALLRSIRQALSIAVCAVKTDPSSTDLDCIAFNFTDLMSQEENRGVSSLDLP